MAAAATWEEALAPLLAEAPGAEGRALLAAFAGAPPPGGVRGVRVAAEPPAAADAAAWEAEGGLVVCPPPALTRSLEALLAARPAPPGPPLLWREGAGAVVFTDGSCEKNGAPGARAGFAAVFMGAAFGGSGAPSVLRGEVPPFELELGGAGLGPAAPRAPRAPSNVRGEWLGVIYALLGVRRARVAGRVEIVTDYRGCAQTLLEWLPARLRKGTERELENFDLIQAAWALFSALEPRPVLTWVRGHAPPPPPSASPRLRLLHRGNAVADEHAGLKARGVALVPGGAPLLAPLARPAWD